MIKTSITGQTMIFKNEKGFYSTSISSKRADGSYANAYIPVQFKKGTQIENKTMVNILNGFLSFDKYTPNGSNKEITSWKLIVTNFELGNGTQNTKASSEFSAPIQSDDDLPF